MLPRVRRTAQERFELDASLGAQLNEHPLVVGQVGMGIEVKFELGVMSATLREPDEHLLRSLLLEVRPFLLAGDDCQVTAAHNVAINHVG